MKRRDFLKAAIIGTGVAAGLGTLENKVFAHTNPSQQLARILIENLDSPYVKKRSDGGYEVETRKGAYIVKATYWPKTNLQTTIQDERLEVTVDYRGTGTFRKYDNRGLRDLPGMVLDEKGSYPNRKLTPEKIPQLAPEKQKNYKAEYEKALAILSQYLRRSGQTK